MKKLFVCIIALCAGIALNAVAGEAGSADATRDATLVSTMSGQSAVSHGSSVKSSDKLGTSVTTGTKVGGSGKGSSLSQGSKLSVGKSTSISQSASVSHATSAPDNPGIAFGAATVTHCVKVEQGVNSQSVCESRLMTEEDADAVIKAAQVLHGIPAASIVGGASYYSQSSMAQSNQVTK